MTCSKKDRSIFYLSLWVELLVNTAHAQMLCRKNSDDDAADKIVIFALQFSRWRSCIKINWFKSWSVTNIQQKLSSCMKQLNIKSNLQMKYFCCNSCLVFYQETLVMGSESILQIMVLTILTKQSISANIIWVNRRLDKIIRLEKLANTIQGWIS